MVAKLKLRLSKKISIARIFLTGLVACGFSIASTYCKFRLLAVDVPNDLWPVCITQGLGAAEVNIGFICCCLPITPIFLRQIFSGSKAFWGFLKDYVASKTSHSSSYDASISEAHLRPSTPHGPLQASNRGLIRLRSTIQKGLTLTRQTTTLNARSQQPSPIELFSPGHPGHEISEGGQSV
ncbi:hypothetical protein F4808DRAFT_327405 [Astrocystis sublimbata]|nr:hypothetical protein F4808DRAFT_327405 [Astrocystis sublimbata]